MELNKLVCDAGILGAGGAGFPTDVSFRYPSSSGDVLEHVSFLPSLLVCFVTLAVEVFLLRAHPLFSLAFCGHTGDRRRSPTRSGVETS